MIDHDELVGDAARPPRRARPRRRHDRHLLHRQRPAHELLAGRRDDAVPQREELELGGRLPRAGDGPLARADPGGHGAQRDRQPQRLVRRRCSPRPATPTSPTSSRRAPTSAARRTRCTSTGTTSCRYLTGEADESPRKHFFYVSDDGDLTALRYDNWKIVFLEQRAHGHAAGLGRAVHRAAGPEDLQPAHRPLRARRHHVEHLLRLDARPRLPARARRRRSSRRCCQTFAEFPPRQKPASFSIEQVLAKLQAGVPSA